MIEVSHLTKKYGDHTAVKDLSFTVQEGKIYGFLGPNGAGKSTTMNIITGCLAATDGDVTIGGYDIFEEPEKAKSLIGYLPEIPPLYTDRTPREYLRFVAEAKRIPKSEIPQQLAYVMETAKITDVADRLIRNLSKGYRQRVGIAQALLGDPEYIILDEPTVGLDPLQIIEIRDLIRSLGGKHTVILSSHILSEVQAVCEEVLVISDGTLVACDTIDHLRERFSGAQAGETSLEEIFIELLKKPDALQEELPQGKIPEEPLTGSEAAVAADEPFSGGPAAPEAKGKAKETEGTKDAKEFDEAEEEAEEGKIKEAEEKEAEEK